MWLFSLIIDLYIKTKEFSDYLTVKNPSRELIYFFICFCLGTLFLILRFSGIVDWQTLNPLVRLAIIPLICFTFPIALAIILLCLKYRPKELGLKWQGVLLVIPLILISFLINQFIFPNSLTLDLVLKESGGFLPMLFSGFVVAGLSEEFFRVIGQTRMAAVFKNAGWGWLLTTTLWAFMHAPKWYSDDHDLMEAIIGSVRIIPLGLMWGYLTYRTKSIWPSIIIHGTNYWGLQNF